MGEKQEKEAKAEAEKAKDEVDKATGTSGSGVDPTTIEDTDPNDPCGRGENAYDLDACVTDCETYHEKPEDCSGMCEALEDRYYTDCYAPLYRDRPIYSGWVPCPTCVHTTTPRPYRVNIWQQPRPTTTTQPAWLSYGSGRFARPYA